MLNDIDILDKLPIDKAGNRIAILGEIVRLGDQSERLHIETARKIGNSKLDIAYCFGDELAELMANELRKQGIESYYTDDREVLNKWLDENVTKRDIVLFKGPVVRLLSKTIDQVYGTSLHTVSEHYDLLMDSNFRVKSIYEKGSPDKRLVALLKYHGESREVKALAEVNGAPVFSVGFGCFRNNIMLEKVEIPEPISNIATEAFSYCTGLKEVKLPNTLMAIEAKAFRGCKALEKIILPEGLREIGAEAFSGCTSLTKVVLPASVGHVGEAAFPEDCQIVYNKAAEDKETLKTKFRRIARRKKKKIKRNIFKFKRKLSKVKKGFRR